MVFLRHSEAGTLWEMRSTGWEFSAELLPLPQDDVVDKLSCDGFRDTGLADVLRRKAIDRLFIGGYAIEFYVDTTIRAAASRGIGVTVVADAHTTRDRPHLRAPSIVAHHNWVWANVANPGNPIRVVPSSVVLVQ